TFARRLCLGLAEPRANRFQARRKLCLESSTNGAIVFSLDAKVVLGSDRVRGVVCVLVAYPVPKPLGPGVMRILYMDGDGKHPAIADVPLSCPDGYGRGV